GDLTDQASCPRSAGSDPQTVISDTVVGTTMGKVAARLSPHSPTSRHNPFNEDSDTNTSADVTPVHLAIRHNTTGDEAEINSNELEVIRMAKRKKPAKKRRGRGSTDSSSSIHTSLCSEHVDMNHSTSEIDSINSTVLLLDSEGEQSRSRVGSAIAEEGGEEGVEGLLRLPEMTDTSMDTVGKPLCDVMERLNGSWAHPEEQEEKNNQSCDQTSEPPAQQPFRTDSEGKPPDPAPGETFDSSLDERPDFLPTSPVSADLCCFTPNSPDSADTSGGHNDSTELSQSQTLSGSLEDEEESEAPAGQKPHMKEEESVQGCLTDRGAEETGQQQEKLSPSEISHPAEFK
ncbi:hypothetical protein GOODEAATRI_033207, partial [Goodea atripinnis]